MKKKGHVFTVRIALTLSLFAAWATNGYAQMETTMPVHPKVQREDSPPMREDSLKMQDVRWLRNISLVVKNMEDSLRIDSINMGSKVVLSPIKRTVIPDTLAMPLRIPYNTELSEVLYDYTRLLSNAMNVNAVAGLVKKVRNKSITKAVFADGLATIESKAIFNQVLTGLETGMIAQLHLPAKVINAGIDHLHGKINTATALYVMFDYIKKMAVDSANQPVYRQFQNYYDRLVVVAK